jgi:hypothetical protein
MKFISSTRGLLSAWRIMKNLSRIHPVLFLASSLIFLYLGSSIIVSPDQLVRPFFVLVLLLLLLAYPAYWLTQDWDWAAILLSILVVMSFWMPTYFAVVAVVGMLALTLLFAYSYLRRHKPTRERFTLLFVLVGSFLVLLSTLSVIRRGGGSPFSLRKTTSAREIHAIALSAGAGEKPDIYYVVLDGYGRNDIFQDYYDYDNSQFLDELSDRGFIVTNTARSNYPKTALSVTSTLNMDYIETLAPGLDDSYYWWLMTPLIDQSNARIALEAIGYQTVSVNTDWGITDNPTTDMYFHPAPIVLSDYEGYIVGVTTWEFIKPVLAKYTVLPSYAGHRRIVEYNFDTLGEISRLPGPQFVFAHIAAPHPPFVFDREGRPLDPDTRFNFNDANEFAFSDDDYKKGYTDQIQYVNKRLLQVVDTILKNSDTLPIIILQGDHGPGMLTDFRPSEATCLRERFSIFAAYYLPGRDADVIPEDITPVNLFRIIFNEYFNAHLPLLERSHYYHRDAVHIYRAEDVTSIVDTCSALPE